MFRLLEVHKLGVRPNVAKCPMRKSAPGNGASDRVAIHPVPDIRRSSGGSDASRVDTSVRGDVVDLAARSTDIH